MGLLDLFSGTAGRNSAIWAANQTASGLGDQLGYLSGNADLSLAALGQAQQQARSDLTGTTQGAAGALAGGFGGALDAYNRNPAAIQGAGNQADQALMRGGDYGDAMLTYGLGTGNEALRSAYGTGDQALMRGGDYGDAMLTYALGQGEGQLRQGANAADAYYQPLAAGADAGYSQYGDAAGVNGTEGQSRARQNFQTGPGYEFMVNQGTNAAARAANATGMGASGNTLDAVTRLGSNLANQEWGSYVNRLSPYLNLAPQIAGQRAGIQTGLGQNLAQLGQNIGGQRANLAGQVGASRASLAGQLGNQQANLANSVGANRANLAGQIGQQRAGQFQHTGDQLAANNAAQAGAFNQYGRDMAGLSTGYGNTLSSLGTGYGTNQSNVYNALGQNLSNVTGAANTATTGMGLAGLQAGQQASANAWNGGMQVANLLANLGGKAMSAFA
jgi:hypothetical protein